MYYGNAGELPITVPIILQFHIYDRESELKTLSLIIIAKWAVLLNSSFVDCSWQLCLPLQYKFHF